MPGSRRDKSGTTVAAHTLLALRATGNQLPVPPDGLLCYYSSGVYPRPGGRGQTPTASMHRQTNQYRKTAPQWVARATGCPGPAGTRGRQQSRRTPSRPSRPFGPPATCCRCHPVTGAMGLYLIIGCHFTSTNTPILAKHVMPTPVDVVKGARDRNGGLYVHSFSAHRQCRHLGLLAENSPVAHHLS